jgi:hypothetical protein
MNKMNRMKNPGIFGTTKYTKQWRIGLMDWWIFNLTLPQPAVSSTESARTKLWQGGAAAL